MISIDIYGAFDFLQEEIKVGELQYERIKGTASYRFAFNEAFLVRFPNFRMSCDLGYYLGFQSSQDGLFSFLNDTTPDRWGRALINKRERILANENNRMVRTFDDFDYLVRIDDETRMGALRFKHNDHYIGTGFGHRTVPLVTEIGGFIRDAHVFEKAEQRGDLPGKESWMDNIWIQGSSLGGARPKINVRDEDGTLWIAKIPSFKDDYDVELWEHFACILAKKAGINVVETQSIRLGPTPYHSLLSRRFDRSGDKRKHFASALTVTGLKDGDNAANGKSYIDIVDAIAGDFGVIKFKENLSELYRRVAFSIIVGNHDDHFRNHGFLLSEKGWELSPAFDLNPTTALTQSLLISPYSNDSSLSELYRASDYYLLNKEEAERIICEVLSASQNWKQVAKNVGIDEKEQSRFANRFEYSLSEGKHLFPDFDSLSQRKENVSLRR